MDALLTLNETDITMATKQLFASITSQMPRPDKWVPFKQDCLFLDLELSGLNPHHRRITQIGVALCHKGEIAPEHAVDLLIQTPYDPQTWDAVYLRPEFVHQAKTFDIFTPELCARIDEHSGSIMKLAEVPDALKEVEDHLGRLMYANASDVTGITAAHTIEHGVSRKEALAVVVDLLGKACRDKYIIVGHNICAFDLPQLLGEIKMELNLEPEIDDDLILDTGMIVKASLCNESLRPGEGVVAFYRRISNMRRKVRWSLDGYCVGAFGLHAKYGVNTEKQHASASYDAWVSSCLVQELAKDN